MQDPYSISDHQKELLIYSKLVKHNIDAVTNVANKQELILSQLSKIRSEMSLVYNDDRTILPEYQANGIKIMNDYSSNCLKTT